MPDKDTTQLQDDVLALMQNKLILEDQFKATQAQIEHLKTKLNDPTTSKQEIIAINNQIKTIEEKFFTLTAVIKEHVESLEND